MLSHAVVAVAALRRGFGRIDPAPRATALSLTQLQHREETALAIWDESVLEKPDGIALGGLCPVRASKAARLKRIKPGFCHPREDRPGSCPRCNDSPS